MVLQERPSGPESRAMQNEEEGSSPINTANMVLWVTPTRTGPVASVAPASSLLRSLERPGSRTENQKQFVSMAQWIVTTPNVHDDKQAGAQWAAMRTPPITSLYQALPFFFLLHTKPSHLFAPSPFHQHQL
ncbi:hypothetical protein BGZ97_005457 [Linnemannia gamsii]|uniref:Uncharacterized protein n=1 Tax=Linnemannia gamsii TaxID=64522 RepID=A0A9P6UGA1_9FUNG|nr:hypothetical protein BGZ97_005457 [Linnemannia gamsii]